MTPVAPDPNLPSLSDLNFALLISHIDQPRLHMRHQLTHASSAPSFPGVKPIAANVIFVIPYACLTLISASHPLRLLSTSPRLCAQPPRLSGAPPQTDFFKLRRSKRAIAGCFASTTTNDGTSTSSVALTFSSLQQGAQIKRGQILRLHATLGPNGQIDRLTHAMELGQTRNPFLRASTIFLVQPDNF
ncbi:MAG: hypothetical protein MMC23_008736 [Stictis urceolatum]|nr:hypothetical protein [Stictis urceolata]